MDIRQVTETIAMIEEQNFDIRTITMGISLLDCIDPDINRAAEKIYQKITTKAANLVAVVALYKLSAKYAVMLNVIRIVVAGLLFTGVFGMLYSLSGATISLIGMILLKKTDLFSITGVSMAGGFLHNMGQLAIAALLINDIRIFYYLPVLMISGTIAGVAIGVAAELVIRRAKFIR